MESTEQKLQEMLNVNVKQKEFYESMEEYMNVENTEGDSLVNRIWSRIRGRFHGSMAEFGIYEAFGDMHKVWLGDLSNKDLLDLGCYDGNPLTIDIARQTKSYFGIDLSEPAINTLNQKLQKAGVKNAKAAAVDFLTPEFQNKYKNKFDIIYAHSVAHHFEHFDVFLEAVKNVLKPGGQVITYDPLQTYFPLRFLRNLYRPFQSDADWEWPFTKNNFELIEKKFKITDVRGSMGKAKYAIPVYVLNKGMGKSLGQKWTKQDFEKSNKLGSGLWSCLHVSMLWTKEK